MRLTICALLLAATASAQETDAERLRWLEAQHGKNVCGNGVLEAGFAEQCDGANLGGKTCADFGFDLGELACAATCEFDTSSCEMEPEPEPDPGGTLASGTWRSIPGSAMRSIYDPAIDRAPFVGNEAAFDRIQSAWSGAVCVGSELVLWGGGHADGAHNGVFAVNVLDGKWRRVTMPATPVAAPNRGATNPDGTPVARHTYQLLASDGKFLYSAGGSIWSVGTPGDPPREWKLDLSSGKWTSFAQSPRTNVSGSLIHVDGKLYYATSDGFARYDIAANSWTNGGASAMNHTTSVVYSSDADRFFGVGATNRGWSRSREEFLTGADKRELPAFTVPAFGAYPSYPIREIRYSGATYYPPEKKALFWQGGPQIVALDAMAETWEVITPAGDPGPIVTTRGVFGRFSYCGGRVVLVNGVDTDLWYLDVPAPEPPSEPPSPPAMPSGPAPYYVEPPGDALVLRDCGPESEWETFDIRTDADVEALRRKITLDTRVVVRVHYRPEPYGNIVVKGGKCSKVIGLPGPNGERPLVPSVNATRSFRGTIRPGGLIVENLIVSAGKAHALNPALGTTVADCLGVPNDQTFFIVRDAEVSQCGHHSFITAHAHHLYVEIGRSSFFQADSHLAYIDHIAMAYVYDSTFESPGWGHALRCVALRCRIERVRVSNVQLDGSVLPLDANPITGEKLYIGMHPLEVYTCGENEVRDVEATILSDPTRNGGWAATLRPREGMNTCDVGQVRDGSWTELPWTSSEFHDPARWATATPLQTTVERFLLKCAGSLPCIGWDVGTSYPFADDPQKAELSKWLKTSAFPTWDALLVALESPVLPWWWAWVAEQTLEGHRASFLKGSITSKVPLPVPVPGWFQRARIRFDESPSLRVERETDTYCLGVPPVAGECVEQNDGRSYGRAVVEVVP